MLLFHIENGQDMEKLCFVHASFHMVVILWMFFSINIFFEVWSLFVGGGVEDDNSHTLEARSLDTLKESEDMNEWEMEVESLISQATLLIKIFHFLCRM